MSVALVFFVFLMGTATYCSALHYLSSMTDGMSVALFFVFLMGTATYCSALHYLSSMMDGMSVALDTLEDTGWLGLVGSLKL